MYDSIQIQPATLTAKRVVTLLKTMGLTRDDIADTDGHAKDAVICAYLSGPAIMKTLAKDGSDEIKYILCIPEGSGEFTEEMWRDVLALMENSESSVDGD